MLVSWKSVGAVSVVLSRGMQGNQLAKGKQRACRIICLGSGRLSKSTHSHSQLVCVALVIAISALWSLCHVLVPCILLDTAAPGHH